MQIDRNITSGSEARHGAVLQTLEVTPEAAEAIPPLAMPTHTALDARLSRVGLESGPAMVKTWHRDALVPFGFDTAADAGMIAARAGIGPAMIAVMPEAESIVMQDLGPDWRPALVVDFLDAEAMVRLMEVKKNFHKAGRVNCALTARELYDYHDAACRRSGALDLPGTVEMGFPQMADWAARIAAALADADEDQVLLHGENCVSNVMIGPDGGMKLVDFDHVSMGDPFRDLGAISNDLCVDDEDRRALLRAWLGHEPAADHMARLKLSGLMDDALWALWAIVAELEPDRQGPELYKYACNRAVRFRVNLSGFDMSRLLKEV